MDRNDIIALYAGRHIIDGRVVSFQPNAAKRAANNIAVVIEAGEMGYGAAFRRPGKTPINITHNLSLIHI